MQEFQEAAGNAKLTCQTIKFTIMSFTCNANSANISQDFLMKILWRKYGKCTIYSPLIMHLRPQTLPVTCKYCYKFFTTPFLRKYHEKTEHITENMNVWSRYLECSDCNISFKDHVEVSVHKKIIKRNSHVHFAIQYLLLKCI